MAVTVTFHGACGTVTGACFEVRTGSSAVLIDCGMFQGTKTIKALNYGAFPFTPASINAVVLTHAHVDHCGLIPKLTVAGFAGNVFATPGTGDLLTYVLPDSGYIQETEVDRLNRRNRQRGIKAVEPIYTREIAEASLRRIRPKPYDSWFEPAPGIAARFWDAGHILGSASVELRIDDGAGKPPITLLFSGDVGPGDKAFQSEPTAPRDVDFVVMESTYGDRVRARRTNEQRRHILAKELHAALRRGGLILIPAFAIERTQELLFDFDALFDSGQLPKLPVFVDSPLAIRATEVFGKHLHAATMTNGTHAFKRDNLHFVEAVEDSKKLNRLRGGAIVMAGSGMCDAGRIRHHLKAHLGQPDTTVILVGYQAPGTLGRLLHGGQSMVRIHGEEIAVAATIRMLDEYSGHADQRRLVAWLKDRLPVRHDVFLVHGEDGARDTLGAELGRAGIERRRIRLPVMGETVKLSKKDGARTVRVRAGVDIAAAERDWHNLYAQTTLALKQKLSGLRRDEDRAALLRQVSSVLAPPTKGKSRRKN
ncbi:MAG: MBL fold metallo-hydrolase [Rhodospirillaceae bacterium]|nr:MBL fold metallo-hydrolase [Rhodospirillaceae bacterium]